MWQPTAQTASHSQSKGVRPCFLHSKAMPRLFDEILTHLGDFLDDQALCALASTERLRWEESDSQRQTRKNEQAQFLST